MGLVLGPIIFVVSFARNLGSGHLGQIGDTNAEFPGFLIAFTTTNLCDILFLGCQIYVAIRFFKKHVTVPRLMVMLMLANIGLAVLSCVWFTSVSQQLDIEGFRAAFTAVVASFIWIPNFLFSKRVKATFIVDPSTERADA